MKDESIWLLLEQQSTMVDATIPLGAYRSYEAAEAALKAKEKAAGWTGESDDDEDREPWWEIETVMLRGELSQEDGEDAIAQLTFTDNELELLITACEGFEGNESFEELSERFRVAQKSALAAWRNNRLKPIPPDVNELCDTCGRTDVVVDHTDAEGKTVCVECTEADRIEAEPGFIPARAKEVK